MLFLFQIYHCNFQFLKQKLTITYDSKAITVLVETNYTLYLRFKFDKKASYTVC